MSTTLRPCLNCIRASLTAALCLRDFPSQTVERHNKPEVEVRSSKELILNPVTISRNADEKCLIEPSINSVRVSVCIKQADEMEEILCKCSKKCFCYTIYEKQEDKLLKFIIYKCNYLYNYFKTFSSCLIIKLLLKIFR